MVRGGPTEPTESSESELRSLVRHEGFASVIPDESLRKHFKETPGLENMGVAIILLPYEGESRDELAEVTNEVLQAYVDEGNLKRPPGGTFAMLNANQPIVSMFKVDNLSVVPEGTINNGVILAARDNAGGLTHEEAVRHFREVADRVEKRRREK